MAYNMESKFDVATMACAVCVAGYVAFIVGYVARLDLGFSLQEIRGAAMVIAVVLAALIVIDFFGKKLGKAK